MHSVLKAPRHSPLYAARPPNRVAKNIIARLLITFEYGERHIWRRIEVNAFTHLRKLHPMILAVMGWPKAPTYQYVVEGSWGGGGRAKIIDLIKFRIEYFSYLCNADGWREHAIFIEQTGVPDLAVHYPRLIDGDGECTDDGAPFDMNNARARLKETLRREPPRIR
jgi:hypothetical protein